MDNEKLYERIEAYLSQQMSQEEAEAFRQEVAAKPELAAELALHQSLAEAIDEEEEVADLGHKISAIITKKNNDKPKIVSEGRFNLRPTLRIAAAIALLIISTIVAYFYLNTDENNPSALYAQFVDYPISIYEEQNVRSENGPVLRQEMAQLDSLWKSAGQLYEEGQNKAALGALKQVEELEMKLFQQPSSRFYYYQGILQAKVEQFIAALTSFELVKINYTEEAAWKRALILLRLENRQEEALLAIKEISTSGHPRRIDARQILERLEASN